MTTKQATHKFCTDITVTYRTITPRFGEEEIEVTFLNKEVTSMSQARFDELFEETSQ